MKKKIHLRLLTSLLLVFFLSASVISKAVPGNGASGSAKCAAFSKGTLPVKPDTQLPFEEKEEEKEQEKEQEKIADSHCYGLFFVYVSVRSNQSLHAAKCSAFISSPLFCGKEPIYLAKLSLLI